MRVQSCMSGPLRVRAPTGVVGPCAHPLSRHVSCTSQHAARHRRLHHAPCSCCVTTPTHLERTHVLTWTVRRASVQASGGVGPVLGTSMQSLTHCSAVTYVYRGVCQYAPHPGLPPSVAHVASMCVVMWLVIAQAVPSQSLSFHPLHGPTVLPPCERAPARVPTAAVCPAMLSPVRTSAVLLTFKLRLLCWPPPCKLCPPPLGCA